MNISGTPLPRVLVVEDEADLREAMVSYLNLEQIAADGVASGAAFVAWMKTHTCDIIVLDLGLPDVDGLTLARGIRSTGQHGLILATARGQIEDRLKGYESGADAYLIKPVDLRELSGVVRTVARRLQALAPPPGWQLDRITWMLRAPDGATVRLSQSEAAILQLLAETPGAAVARNRIIIALGAQPDSYDPRRLEILVRRLRGKVLGQLGQALPLETVHAVGYALTASIRVESSFG